MKVFLAIHWRSIIATIIVLTCIASFVLNAKRSKREKTEILSKRMFTSIIVFALAVLMLGFSINYEKDIGVEANKERYPLDVEVKVVVDREELNSHYDSLSEEELRLFELSKNNSFDTYVTRTGNNVLLVRIGEESFTFYSPEDGKTSNNWVLVVNQKYFSPVTEKVE